MKGVWLSVAAALVIIAALSVAAYVILVRVPTDLAQNTAQGIRESLYVTPRVTIDETVVIEQDKKIIELAMLARRVIVDHAWSQSWIGSTKTIALRGTFTAKAGFDLKQPFAIDIHRFPLRVVAHVPPARLVSVEMNSYNVVNDENGLWNRISDQDRAAAVGQLMASARQKAEASGILEEAQASVERRIRDIVERHGSTVDFSGPSASRR